MGQERPVQHGAGKDEEEVHGEVTALEDWDDIMEVPQDDYADEQESEEFDGGVPGSRGIHKVVK